MLKNLDSKFKIKNQKLANVSEVISIILITLISAIFIFKYGEIFYNFGIKAKSRLTSNPVLAFFIAPVFFWISAYLCRRFSKKSSGNTMTHIETSLIYLNKNPNSLEKLTSVFNLRAVIINCVSSLISTFGGGALGREAPSVYMSASLFAIVAQKLRSFLPKISLEAWICAGTAAGFAAAFHSPIAGFVYVVEKLFNSKSKNFFSDIFRTTIALFVVIILLHNSQPLFATYNLNLWFGYELLVVALISSFCGVLSFLFKKISIFFYNKTSKIKSNLWHLIPIIAGFAVSTLSIYGGVNSFSGDINLSQDGLDQFDFSYFEVFIRMTNSFITFISGCAGGLVAPSIAIGAEIGLVFSDLMKNVDKRVFVLAGMSAFLTPILGTPFAAAIVIVEASSQPILAFPFMFFSSAISSFFSSLISKILKK